MSWSTSTPVKEDWEDVEQERWRTLLGVGSATYVSGDTGTVVETGRDTDPRGGIEGDIEEPEELPDTYTYADAEGEAEGEYE